MKGGEILLSFNLLCCTYYLNLELTIYDNLPETFLSKMMPAIVGFELKVEKIDNVFKLSQNRDEKSYLNIISKLSDQGGSSALIAEEMKNRKSALFPPGDDWDGSKFDS